MKILRVFNNNVVLARDDAGRDVVLTGRGLGFQARPGQPVDTAKVAKTFVPDEGRSADSTAAMIADIAPEYLALMDSAVHELAWSLPQKLHATTLLALADHLNFALKRVQQSITVDYPLRAELEHLYPRELAVGEAIVRYVNERLPTPIPDDEAGPFALHLVNASFQSGDLSRTYRMTGLLNQIFEVIEGAFGRALPHDGINVARFITHLRYFFVRVEAGDQLDEGRSPLTTAIQTGYPDAYTCALRIAEILQLRLGQAITADETIYLAMHVARLTASDSDHRPTAP